MLRFSYAFFLHFFISIFLFPYFAKADPSTYTLDPKHSYVLWLVNHLGFSEQSGKWPVEGDLILNTEKPEESHVKIKINLNSLITGNRELDQHLKSKEFFDTARYPTATFVATKINVIDDKKAEIVGDLTLHGVTKPVTLAATFNKQGGNLFNNKETVGFSAEASLKRSDFGITAFLLPGGGGLGDTVNLHIQVEAYKQTQNKK